ncbi:uncharacterized protein RAG0_03451 [Rhynchosporium agropyri]|uniref:DUF952 domain protein n=1 Tax=Rhynchosporium agropyri TaxID=914238 RepID=A0A1E1K8M8_9HELO|nr:uncharacterized protein RAG0_03451 [Rhynchosporium agropyri]
MSHSAPTPPPKYIYKILPSSPPPRSPLPLSLPLSSLDAKDNFMHLSTSSQILGTLKNFFSSEPHVYILRIPYERVAKFVTWEDSKKKGAEENGGPWDVDEKRGYFPHIYANAGPGEGQQGLKMGRDEVESVCIWKKGDEVWNARSWPFEEDHPKE